MITVLHAGLFDSIQDLGRPGHSVWGIAPGGAVDMAAASLANALAGNGPEMAVLELHFPAATLAVDAPACIALSGGDFTAQLADASPVPLHRPFRLSPGSRIRFLRRKTGARVYLAVSGGIEGPGWLQSRSAGVATGLPGLLGRPLRQGDRLSIGPVHPARTWSGGAAPWYAASKPVAGAADAPTVLRFVPGPEWQYLPAAMRRAWAEQIFRVDAASNRMGLRLNGDPIRSEAMPGLISGGVTFGTIQLLPEGQLVVLLADRGATGGYPCPGVVAAVDWPLLAQGAANDRFIFRRIAIDEAEKLYLEARRQQARLELAARLQWL